VSAADDAFDRAEVAFVAAVANAGNASQVDPSMALPSKPTVCILPPAGWYCTRAPGHDGPCAALPVQAGEATPLTDERIKDIAQGLYHADHQDDPHGYDIALARRIETELRASLAPVSAPKATHNTPNHAPIEQLEGAPVSAQPIYQVKMPGAVPSAWNDATESAYHTFMPEHRRIVYAAPVSAQQGAAVAKVWIATGRYGREARFGSINMAALEEACVNGSVQVFIEQAAAKAPAAQAVTAPSDAQIIAALHANGIDTYPSKCGFDAVQVSATSVPNLRNVLVSLAASPLDHIMEAFIAEADADDDAELRAGGPKRLLACDYFKRGYLAAHHPQQGGNRE
jgi:hypothetical protein